jgi:16S rRNA G527 N7-methylase RsmG
MAVFKLTWRVTLLESNQRKAVFLRESTRELPNVTILAQRGTSISTPFDWLVSRGVNLGEVLQHLPQLAPRIGLMLSMDDFTAIESMQGIAWREPVRLPWGNQTLCAFGEISRGT